jgi:DNA-binding NarL/FixJ family response regulator
MITVAMVEDHPIVLAGLARIVAALPDMQLVATAGRIEDLPSKLTPDVVLLDLHLPGPLDGLSGVRYLVDLGWRVLVVTGDDASIEEVGDAVAAGALGYLTKHAAGTEYATAIRAVAAGHVYLGARLAACARRDSHRLGADDSRRLTPREAEVAGLVVDGYTNAEIAGILGVGERTIDGHLENIKKKICETRRVRVAMRLRELGYQPPLPGQPLKGRPGPS